MLIFVAWPTANVALSNECAKVWMGAGYKVAVATDLPRTAIRGIKASVPPLMIKEWKGYYGAVNALAFELVKDFRADVVIAGSDMILPCTDLRPAALGTAFAQRFPNEGMGVMLPVADSWVPEQSGGMAHKGMGYARKMHATPISRDRCEGAWLGRRFIRESLAWGGPFHEGYTQYFGDCELHDVAEKMGLLFKLETVRQQRIHWSRSGGPPIRDYQAKAFDACYEKDYALWRARRYRGYPGSKPLLIPEGAGKIILP